MKSFIVFALLVAAAAAAPAGPDANAQVLRKDFDNIGVDGISHASETSNGIKQQATGTLKDVGTENEALEVVGFFSYVGDDGVPFTIEYTADENGFRPRGAHIPV